MKRFFSIIIPTYNRSEFIGRAIQSVLNQNFADWELIIIDDGSTDNTESMVDSFRDDRITYYYQENQERSAARNKGIELSKGDWICFLDSDDEYLPNHLSSLKKAIDNDPIPRLLITGHYISKNGVQLKHPLISNDQQSQLEEISRKFILMNSVCVNRSIVNKNNFNLNFRIWEDTHLWLRIAAQFPVQQLEEYTCIQNVHGGSTVVQGLRIVKLSEMDQYINAIQDLRDNYSELFNSKLNDSFFNNYIAEKHKMYLYQARQNKQLYVALAVWWKATFHKPSWYLLTEFPKIFLNQLNIGIHDR